MYCVKYDILNIDTLYNVCIFASEIRKQSINIKSVNYEKE